MTATDGIAEHADAFVAIRRKLHSEPELGYAETKTSALVAGLLADWGYEVASGIGGTGVVGTLKNGSGSRSLGIRADMDALPMTEATGLGYASKAPGAMHACGHDGHTAILLAAARELAATKRFSGTLRVIFQPAEETGGGASKMIGDGLFERFPVDAVFGLHNWPGIPAGEFHFLAGPAMASVELAIIEIAGRGGHGARPHETVDPVVAAASLVMALQTIVSRNVDPLEAAVITVGSVHGGNAPNVIPESVELQVTIRAFSQAVSDLIRQRIVAMAETHAASYGAVAKVTYPLGFPVLVNHAHETDIARRVALARFGEARVGTFRPSTASEDFAHMLERKPGAYLFVGNGDTADLHSPKYDFNDAILPDAARYWVALAEDYLAA